MWIEILYVDKSFEQCYSIIVEAIFAIQSKYSGADQSPFELEAPVPPEIIHTR